MQLYFFFHGVSSCRHILSSTGHHQFSFVPLSIEPRPQEELQRKGKETRSGVLAKKNEVSSVLQTSDVQTRPVCSARSGDHGLQPFLCPFAEGDTI
jgi:hypothetical protein